MLYALALENDKFNNQLIVAPLCSHGSILYDRVSEARIFGFLMTNMRLEMNGKEMTSGLNSDNPVICGEYPWSEHSLVSLSRALPYWCWDRIFSGQLGQYHGCWCTVSSRRQVIISHGIYCVGQTGIWPDLTESVDMFHVPWNNIAHNKLIHSFNGLMYNQQTQLCMWGDLWMSERSVSHIYVVECIQNIWYDVYVQINPSKKISKIHISHPF